MRLTVRSIFWVGSLLCAFGTCNHVAAQHATEHQLHAPSLNYEALPVPRFTFRDLGKKPHRLADQRGKVVVLNFWGTWCPGCVLELPTLQALYNRYRDDKKVAFLIVSGMDTTEKVRQFRDSRHMTLPMYMIGNDRLPKGFDSGAWPATYFISADGMLRAEDLGGANWNDDSIVKLIEQLKSLKPL